MIFEYGDRKGEGLFIDASEIGYMVTSAVVGR